MNINQATNKAIINWNTVNIGSALNSFMPSYMALMQGEQVKSLSG